MTQDSPVVVVYVGGTGRSGSTILANLLGEVPGYVSVGEVRFLWQRGMLEDRLCGCGVSFAECPFWSEVLAEAFGSEVPDPTVMHSMVRSRTRMRTLPRVMRGRHRAARQSPSADGSALETGLTALYEAIAVVSGSSVIVDSSKLPTYAAVIDALPGLDVRLLHLVRDPRASAFSWLRRKELTDQRAPTYMEQRGVTKSAVLWTVWNWVLERMWRGSPASYRRLTYEGLLENPESTLQSVVEWIDQGGDPLACFTGERSVTFGVHHTVAGNPGRMAQGEVSLTIDDEWTRALDSRSKRIIALVTRPLLRRYGYPPHGVLGTTSVE
jgi:hypothetical protein